MVEYNLSVKSAIFLYTAGIIAVIISHLTPEFTTMKTLFFYLLGFASLITLFPSLEDIFIVLMNGATSLFDKESKNQ